MSRTMIWCEHCRDHFSISHYDEQGHLVGDKYGPTGTTLAKMQKLQARVEYLESVIRENCHPDSFAEWLLSGGQ